MLHIFFRTVFSLMGPAWFVPKKDNNLFCLQRRKKVAGVNKSILMLNLEVDVIRHIKECWSWFSAARTGTRSHKCKKDGGLVPVLTSFTARLAHRQALCITFKYLFPAAILCMNCSCCAWLLHVLLRCFHKNGEVSQQKRIMQQINHRKQIFKFFFLILSD